MYVYFYYVWSYADGCGSQMKTWRCYMDECEVQRRQTTEDIWHKQYQTFHLQVQAQKTQTKLKKLCTQREKNRSWSFALCNNVLQTPTAKDSYDIYNL